jgi:hypothetical protein
MKKNKLHNTLWYILLPENVGGVKQHMPHILQNDEGSIKGPSQQKCALLRQ